MHALGSFLAALEPTIPIIAAVVAAITGLILIIQNWGDICEWFGSLWEGVCDKIKAVWDGIKKYFSDIFGAIAAVFTQVFTGIKDFLSGIWDSVAKTCSAAWDSIKNVVEFALKLIASVISGAAQIITLPFTVFHASQVEGISEYTLAWLTSSTAESTLPLMPAKSWSLKSGACSFRVPRKSHIARKPSSYAVVSSAKPSELSPGASEKDSSMSSLRTEGF